MMQTCPVQRWTGHQGLIMYDLHIRDLFDGVRKLVDAVLDFWSQAIAGFDGMRVVTIFLIAMAISFSYSFIF